MASRGVADVAAELGVSPRRVRQMLADGVLDGERIGRTWVIEDEQSDELKRRRRKAGRPLSPKSAWAVLALADGHNPSLSPVERARARNRLARGLTTIADQLDARAKPQRFYGHPRALDRLTDAPEVVRGGISAAADHGGDLVSVGEVEGYVRAGDLDKIVSKFALDSQATRLNVLLRVVDDAVWPFQPGQRVAGPAVVAIDLYESDDARSRRAGANMMRNR